MAKLDGEIRWTVFLGKPLYSNHSLDLTTQVLQNKAQLQQYLQDTETEPTKFSPPAS